MFVIVSASVNHWPVDRTGWTVVRTASVPGTATVTADDTTGPFVTASPLPPSVAKTVVVRTAGPAAPPENVHVNVADAPAASGTGIAGEGPATNARLPGPDDAYGDAVRARAPVAPVFVTVSVTRNVSPPHTAAW